MSEATLTCTTYIRAADHQVWDALTDPAATSRWWGVRFETDWRPESSMTWSEETPRGTVRTAGPGQKVLEAERPRRLAYTWHVFTAEWAAAQGVDDELHDRLVHEGASRVTFTVDPAGGPVRLQLVHEFDVDGALRSMVGRGWPALLASLKSQLETGEPLADLDPSAADR